MLDSKTSIFLCKTKTFFVSDCETKIKSTKRLHKKFKTVRFLELLKK